MGQTYIYVKNKSFQRLGCLAENCLRSLEKLDPTRSWFWFQSSGQVCWSRLIQTFSTFFCVSEVPRKLAFNFRPPVTNGWDFSDGWSFYLIEYQTSSAITTLLHLSRSTTLKLILRAVRAGLPCRASGQVLDHIQFFVEDVTQHF